VKHLSSIRVLWFVPFVTVLSLACSEAGAPAPAPELQLASCEVELSEVAVYQSLKISLGTGDTPVAERNAELIAGKPALFRVFVKPTSDTPVEDVTVRLSLDSPSGRRSYDRSASISAASRDDVMASTLDVQVPGEDIQPESRVAVEIVSPSRCAGMAHARFPRTGELSLDARAIGALRVHLVPLRYDADGSGRLPDTSPAQLQAFRDALLAMYPVADVQLTVREPVPTSVAVAPKSGWAGLLDVVKQTRAHDRPADDVYYFGLVAPADTHARYCGNGCTTGVSLTPRKVTPSSQASVGLGFPNPVSVDALVHELGHAHGRAHAPCGGPERPDPSFPYAEALIGSWGYDARGTGELRSPAATRDIMGYCGPRWVSDYTYRGLTDRSAAVNGTGAELVASRLTDGSGQEQTGGLWRTVVLGADATVTWGAIGQPPSDGTDLRGQLLGPAGEPLGELDVRELEISDSDDRLFSIPVETGAASTLLLPGLSPIPLAPAPQ
jgi:hypothetical protein